MHTKLDIGCGARCAEGFSAWDIKDNNDARALVGIADGSLDAIRAIHVLEHIPYEETINVLREWARGLRVGGELFVAVPDFDKIVEAHKGRIWAENILRPGKGGQPAGIAGARFVVRLPGAA